MSTVILDRDHEGKKAGETISVPFGKGKEMLAAGIAHRPAGTPSPQSSGKEIRAANDQIEKVKADAVAALKRQDAEHKAEIAKLKADAKEAFDMADKATAENSELKKQIADLQKQLAAKPHGGK